MYLYALLDKATELFSFPFCAPADGMAARQLGQLLQDPRSNVGKFPRDFSLWILGEYDEKTGHITTDKTFPRHLIEAAILLKEIKSQNPELPLEVAQ